MSQVLPHFSSFCLDMGEPGNEGIPYLFSDYKMFQLSSGIGFAEFVKWRINEWRKQGKQVLKIMVAGKVGAGNSALVNGLIGREVAVEGDSAASVTTTVNQYKKVINGVAVIIFFAERSLGTRLMQA